MEITQRARGLLIRGDCLGVLPTPIAELYHVADVEEVELHRAEMGSIWNRFSEAARSMVMGLLNKVRGAADLRKRVVFMPQDDSKPRILFARAHELGHQVLPWHYVNDDYLDNDQTLSPRVKGMFEAEANLFAAEAIFQGSRFRDLARQYRPEFASIFELARLHGASRHATFWRFVEVHEEALAGLIYCPVNCGSGQGFALQTVLRSSSFETRYRSSITFDTRVDFEHPWAAARHTGGKPLAGEMPISVDGRTESFLWEAFWNGYNLMVLLRRRPVLHSMAHFIRRAPWN